MILVIIDIKYGATDSKEFLVPKRSEHTRSHLEHEGKDGQQRQYLVGDRREYCPVPGFINPSVEQAEGFYCVPGMFDS